MNPIHVIEPTLRDRAGHCFSHMLALLDANAALGLPLELWIGREAPPLFEGETELPVHGHFHHRWRRPQMLLLLRRLLREPGRIYLPTGSRRDLVMLDLVAKRPLPPERFHLLFHWLHMTAARRRTLSRLARRHPEVVPLAPSHRLVEVLRECGFGRAAYVPYPITPVRLPAGVEPRQPFRHVLFGGAARRDKGFGRIVEIAELLARTGADLPLLVQTSPPERGVHEPAVAALLERLDAAGYAELRRVTATLDERSYFEQYCGAVSLQVYDRDEYAHERISGVTLDALSCGSPIVATAGTWMARQVERFGAGVVLEDLDAESVLEAARAVADDFETYRDRALDAGRTLAEENSGVHVLRAISE